VSSSKTGEFDVALGDRSGSLSSRSVSRPRWFYVGISLFMVALVLAGFWPSYFGPLLRGVTARPPVIQIHGIVFVGWMVLLVTQVAMVAVGRTALHRRIGSFGVIYGFLVLLMGVIAGVAAPVMHFKNGEWTFDRAAGFLLISLGDMALFGSFFIAAMIYRRKPEVHKRLIVMATIALLFAAVGRMSFIQIQALLLPLWLSPLLAGMAYDLLTRRKVHATYIVGGVWLLIGFSRVFFTESESWLRIGRVLLRPFVS
jgi:hypothetical protein